MSRNVVETILGGVVLVVAIGFFGWAYGRSNVGDPGGYTLHAQFDRIDGLGIGADVRVSGIKVGKVLSQSLNPETYRADVVFSVMDSVKLPSDSTAAVVSSGLLGGKYLALAPGGDEAMLADGGEITLTQSSVNLEDLIGKYIFGQGGGAAGAAQ
ncbi:MAG: outer membrane lipid asymmetry maintenance protein MlaD [Geminicoccaceae bacterium]